MRVKKLNVASRGRQPSGVSVANTPSTSGILPTVEDSSTAALPPKRFPIDTAEGQSLSGSRCESPTDTSSRAALTGGVEPASSLLDRHAFADSTLSSIPMAQQRQQAGSSAVRSWRDHVAVSVRETLRGKIAALLRSMKPNAPAKVLERLPGMAQRMEESLLHIASNEQEYMDPSTLKQRLSLIQESSTKRHLQQQMPPSISPKHNMLRQRTPLKETQAQAVFQSLQRWRLKLVDALEVIPTEIIPNQTLARVALYAPTSPHELKTCGLTDAQVARYGTLLLQELQLILTTPFGTDPTKSPALATPNAPSVGPVRKLSSTDGKRRTSSDTSSSSGSKKRKSTSEPAQQPFLAPTPRLGATGSTFVQPTNVQLQPGNGGASTPFIPPTPTLFMRPPQMDMATTSNMMGMHQVTPSTLPTLLPSTTPSNGTKKATMPYGIPHAPPAVRMGPGTPLLQQPFFTQLQPTPTSAPENSDSHIHLLANSAGQLSKQHPPVTTTTTSTAALSATQRGNGAVSRPQVPSTSMAPPTPVQVTTQPSSTLLNDLMASSSAAYEKEIQSLRWALQQSQQEKTQLEMEVQQLRQQMQQIQQQLFQSASSHTYVATTSAPTSTSNSSS